jgi:putative ABC transport system permease protein
MRNGATVDDPQRNFSRRIFYGFLFHGAWEKRMAKLLHDVRYGIRMLLKSPGFTIVAVLTLALGIGANTAIFSVVQSVLLRPLPYPEPSRLVEISNSYLPIVPKIGLSAGDFTDWRRQATTVSEMSTYTSIAQGSNLIGAGESQRVQGSYASASFFPMLGIKPVVGRSFLPEEEKAGSAPVVMLSHHLWQSQFGADPAVVNRSITLDTQRYTIIGVLPADFQFLKWADLWMPMGQFPDDLTSHVHHNFDVIARLKPGATVSQAQAEMTNLNRQEEVAFPDTHRHWGVTVARMEAPEAGQLRSTLLVLSGAVGLVLLIACANIVNLLLVRNAARQREIALRIALGASKWRLMRQLLTEATVLSLAGGVFGLLLGLGALQALLALVPGDLATLQGIGLNRWVLAFAAAVCLLAGLICGALPALQALKTDLNDVLKQGSKGASAFGSHRIHNALVVAEVAMALVPLIGAGLLLRSFRHLLGVAPGFETDHVLTMNVPQAALSPAQLSKLNTAQQLELGQRQSEQFEQIAAEIQALPGVHGVGGIDDMPLGSQIRQATRFLIEGQTIPPADARPVLQFRTVSLGYFSTLNIPLLQGRFFTPDDWKLQNVVVINETMARRFWPDGDPLGKRINTCSLAPTPCWTTIIGVVGNVHQFGLEAEPTFDAYFSGGWTPYFVIRASSNPEALVAAVTEIIHKADATLPVTQVITMDDLLSTSVSPRRFSAVLVGIFAVLAVSLAAVGIYGVMSYVVRQRTNEIGIRMALGAQPGDVRRLVVNHGAKLTAIGVAIGLAGALALTRVLSSMLFGVKPTDPLTFSGVALLLAGVAALACYVPARRAMRVDPMVALRYD